MGRWHACLYLLTVTACGGTVVSNNGEDDDRIPMLPDDLPPPPAGCSEVRLVPAGKAWLGGAHVADDGTPVVHTCDAPHPDGGAAQRFAVGDVFLDAFEVTNTCYAACVDAGACGEPLPPTLDPIWQEPALVDHAVHVVAEAAEAFCAWRGGRLPTLLELVRASHGDRLHIGNPTLYEKVWSCYQHELPEATCLELEQHQGGELPVAAIPEDEGPFGHRDLFGGLADSTGTVLKESPCDYPADAPDPGAFAAEDEGDEAYRSYFRVHVDRPTVPPPQYANYTSFATYGSPIYGLGVRCAYNPVYVEEP